MIDQSAVELLSAAQAQAQLARRELARRTLFNFITYTKPDYVEGWFLKEICQILDAFEQDVIAQRSPNVMIFLPPGSGKSEIVTRRWPAYILGRHPEWHWMTATYGDDLSQTFGRDVRSIIEDPAYQQLFPIFQIRKDANAVSDWITTAGGKYLATSVGGAATGKRYHIGCIEGSQPVVTRSGIIPMRELQAGMEVPTPKGWRRVVNAWSTGVRPTVRVTGEGGHILRCTPDHKVYTSSRGWVQASALAPEDTYHAINLPNLQERLSTERALAPVDMVLAGVLGRAAQAGSFGPSAEVRSLFGPHLIQSQRRKAGGAHGRALLLNRLPYSRLREDGRKNPASTGIVRLLRHRLPAAQFADAILFDGMQEPGARGFDAGEQSESQGRGVDRILHQEVQERNIADDPRRCEVLGVRRSGRMRASPGRDEEQRCAGELGSALPFVPYHVSQVEADGPAECYDCTVEGEHCFVAGGMLVHNCVDDPIKDQQDADSPAKQKECWDWFHSVFSTRRFPGAGRIIVQTPWTLNDTALRLLDVASKSPEADQWTVYRFPAIATKDERHRKAGEVLHPERYSLREMTKIRATYLATGNARTWSALYQCDPTPESGIVFTPQMFKFYNPVDLPENLVHYGTNDFAFDSADSDPSMVADAGVDEHGNIYFVEFWHGIANPETTVERLLDFVEKYNQYEVVMENIHITKTIGPHLRRRMRERNLNVTLRSITPHKSKQTRAGSLRGRMSQGKVFFPNIPFVTDVLMPEYMRFPAGRHDETIDIASLLCLALDTLQDAAGAAALPPPGPPPYSYDWMQLHAKRVDAKAKTLMDDDSADDGDRAGLGRPRSRSVGREKLVNMGRRFRY